MNIAVLAGGISAERNVSINSARAVAEALAAAGHTLRIVDPALGAAETLSIDTLRADIGVAPSLEELIRYKKSSYLECVTSDLFDGVDLVVNLLHGAYGEDGYMQSLLDLKGLSYTGSARLASAMSMNKAIAKRLLESAHIPSPEWLSIAASQAEDSELLNEVRDYVGSHVIVKPHDQGSSVGVSYVNSGNIDDLRQAIQSAGQYSRVVIIERYIHGTEISVCVLNDEALPIVEISSEGDWLQYGNKYQAGAARYTCPGEFDDHSVEYINGLATMAHTITACRSFSKVDFRIDEDGQVFCLEINALPALTPDSVFATAAAAADIDFGQLCERIVELARP